MKTAKQWQEELKGETSVESIMEIQRDALLAASIIISKKRDAVYVGSNPIREGVRRGLSDASIAVLEIPVVKE